MPFLGALGHRAPFVNHLKPVLGANGKNRLHFDHGYFQVVTDVCRSHGTHEAGRRTIYKKKEAQSRSASRIVMMLFNGFLPVLIMSPIYRTRSIVLLI